MSTKIQPTPIIGEAAKKICETCIYYDTDKADQPCCCCFDGLNWEEYDGE